MVQAIQVLRFHLLELEKVSEWNFAISQELCNSCCIILLYCIIVIFEKYKRVYYFHNVIFPSFKYRLI